MKFGKENEKLEFKKTTAELSEGVISMVAILNKHGGGELYFGIRNDGTPLGLDISDKTLRDVSEAVSNHIEPKIYPEINAVYVGDTHCIHVKFEGDNAPYYAFGRAYVRVADSDKQMSAAELKNYILKHNIGHGAWDGDISRKTAADVDVTILSDYIDRANRAGRIDFAYTNNAEVLNRLGVTEDGKLKNAADVLFCGSPNLEIQMAIFAGTERLTFNDINRKSGSVTKLVEIAETYIRNNIRWRVVLDGSIQRKEIPEIPIEAIREAIINSYCHRQYTLSQNNEITIYSNRVEIYNPGRFPEGLTPQDFINGKERSKKRNPLLAQLMYYSKDIESFGTGLKRITEACDEASVKVEFEMLKLGFAVVFYRPDEKFITTKKMSDVVRTVVTNVALKKSEQAVLEAIAKNSTITAEQLAATAKKSGRTVQRYLDSLQKKNLIRRVGSTKSGRWEIVADTESADE
ncbi:MAG: putative DNA binding domain-containing protein [Desulfarculales bacterium]|jgi:ATP-dependent DNA helicase RecG|nr:putative DNA binding domain-containing protein [Desulfarculales bacterium]